MKAYKASSPRLQTDQIRDTLMANPARWASGLPEGASDKVTLAAKWKMSCPRRKSLQ